MFSSGWRGSFSARRTDVDSVPCSASICKRRGERERWDWRIERRIKRERERYHKKRNKNCYMRYGEFYKEKWQRIIKRGVKSTKAYF